MEYDILVGVNTKNCESTIQGIVKTIDRALAKHFSKYGSLIVCSDGFSDDKTKEKFMAVKTIAEKKVLTEKGKRGKGSAVKTIIQKAKMHGVKAVLLIDGDLLSLKEEHIKKLVEPVLKDEFDVILAGYSKDKNDALISSHLVYPLTRALFNADVRHPIAGEFCLSQKACTKLLNSRFFPNDFGVDIFITITGLCEDLNVAEVRLGAREHLSSRTYSKPEDSVMPAFSQVMREFIQLARYYKSSIIKESRPKIKKIGKISAGAPKKIPVSISSYRELSRGGVLGAEDYAEKVYDCLSDQSIIGMKVAWLGWLSIYFEKTKSLSNARAEQEIEKLAGAFEQKKSLARI
jgi:glycosyltransferase involved in cell wall biosynthesis